MRTTVKKWGNSLAVRIPRSFAAEAGLESDGDVEMKLVEGSLIITALERPDARLSALLDRITDENRHGEIDDGAPVGSEAW